MAWVKFRYLKVTGPQKWQWENIGGLEKEDEKQLAEIMEERTHDEAVRYGRARMEWEFEDPPPEELELMIFGLLRRAEEFHKDIAKYGKQLERLLQGKPAEEE